MPIYTEGAVIRRGQTLEEFETPFADYLGAKFHQAIDSNPVSMIGDTSEFNIANSGASPVVSDPMTGFQGDFSAPPAPPPRLTAEEIKARADAAGVKVDVPPEGLSDAALQILIKRRQRQAAQNDAIERSPTGSRSVAGFGASLGASLLDPLNIGLAFVPVVGEARYASMVAKAGTPLARAGVRAGVGAAEGAAGIAAFEPFNYGMHQTLQDDYSMMDSLMNIGFGSVMGGGLHVVGGAFRDHVMGKWWEPDIPPAKPDAGEIPTLTNVAEPIKIGEAVSSPHPVAEPRPEANAARFDPNTAASTAEAVTPATRETSMRTAVGQLMDGRVVDVEPILRADPRANVPQTELPAFKEWFGDSQVRDANGQPLVVYHGTKENIEKFDTGKNSYHDEVGTFFTTKPDEASAYAESEGGNVIPSYLSVTNPYSVTSRQWASGEGLSPRQARDDGYDGYIIQQNDGSRHIVAFRPEQIKSAIGNSGRFDPNSGSLTDQVVSSVQRQTSPESVRVADPQASEAADVRLKEARPSESLQDAEAELATVMKDLQERYVPVGTAESMYAELKPYDDAIKAADELSLAARAAAICDLRG